MILLLLFVLLGYREQVQQAINDRMETVLKCLVLGEHAFPHQLCQSRRIVLEPGVIPLRSDRLKDFRITDCERSLRIIGKITLREVSVRR